MMRTRASLGVVFLLVAANATTAAEAPAFLAQIELANGLQTVSFSSPAGVIRVYLPDDLRPGDTISGTVSLAPQGTSQQSRVTNATMLGSYTVEFEQQRSPVNSPTMTWTLPAEVSPAGTALVLQNDQGEEVARTLLPVMARVQGAAKAFHLPEIGQTGRMIETVGPFDGDFSTTELKVDDEVIALVAESPRKLIARNSYSKQGMTLLGLRERERTAEMDFRSIAVNLTAPKTSLVKGEATTLTVKVLGLDGLNKAISLELVNTSAEVITLSGGDSERFRIEPAAAVEGSVTIERSVTGIKRGSWSISCSVVKAD